MIMYTYVCLCTPLASFYVLVGLFYDNPGPACPDPEVWIDVEPTVEDQAFLDEQSDQSRSFLSCHLLFAHETSTLLIVSILQSFVYCTY